MIKALLTIDDIASANTPAVVDDIVEKNIPAIMFGWGENIEAFFDNAVYALKAGIIVGNHSYSHPHFSEISYDECIEEIEKNEAILDRLYAAAGVERKYRPFRFPYGDKGGDKKDALQKYLKEKGFDKVDDAKIPVDRKVLDKIKRSMGFKDEEELMNFQGLKMVNALLFSASDYNPLEEPQILAKCTLMVLGLEDCIGKTDSDTAMKVFKTLKK